MTDTADRAAGALYGLAVGDALGMPTQMYSRAEVACRFGRLTGFAPAPGDHPIAAGLAAGTVTDDTEQALILGRLLVDGGGRVDLHAFADALLRWEADMVLRGSADLLGPSTRRALLAVGRGEPLEAAGRWGDTNGAAMRIAPVGVAAPPAPLEALVDRVADVSRLTHDTSVAIAGAAAVAAAVSAGVDGAEPEEALRVGAEAAAAGAHRGHWVAGADVATRIAWAVDLVRDCGEAEALDRLDRLVGTSVATQESVPAAFACVVLAGGDPWRAGLLAAGLGGDSDTVGAMAGAIAGACGGAAALPRHAVHAVEQINALGVEALAADLLALRRGTAPTEERVGVRGH